MIQSFVSLSQVDQISMQLQTISLLSEFDDLCAATELLIEIPNFDEKQTTTL
jgi:hypothetical protein